MGSTVTSLRLLYVALGGSASTVANKTLIPDLIDAITALVTASGGQLPAVTAADNGKVLKVTDGEWAVGTDAT